MILRPSAMAGKRSRNSKGSFCLNTSSCGARGGCLTTSRAPVMALGYWLLALGY